MAWNLTQMLWASIIKKKSTPVTSTNGQVSGLDTFCLSIAADTLCGGHYNALSRSFFRNENFSVPTARMLQQTALSCHPLQVLPLLKRSSSPKVTPASWGTPHPMTEGGVSVKTWSSQPNLGSPILCTPLRISWRLHWDLDAVWLLSVPNSVLFSQ